MNKKFSTLLAGVALLGAMSANAGNPVTSLQKTGNGLYQLKAAGGVLAMTPEGALKLEATTESANLASTLWCVEVTEEGYGKAPIFDFTNKATGFGSSSPIDCGLLIVFGLLLFPLFPKYPVVDKTFPI